MSYVLNFINSLPPEVWETLIAALFLSPFMLGIKKWLNIHRELVMTLYVIGGAFITAALAYVQSTPDFAPWLVIPIQGLVTFALSQPVYYAIVKPLRNRWRTLVTEAEEVNNSKRAAVISPEQVPVTEFK